VGSLFLQSLCAVHTALYCGWPWWNWFLVEKYNL